MLRFLMLFMVAIGLPLIACASGTKLTVENAEGEAIILDSEKALLYIDKYLHIAISEMDRSGIPASIKLAQGILESGSGMSSLARYAHNHFGIKCGGGWKGKTYYLWDDDVVKSCFRVFEKDEDSYIAHSNFIANPYKKSRYGFLFDLDRTDYKSWANGLQRAGYATSQTYARSLISIIERYELYKLDHLTFRCMAVSEGEIDSLFNIVCIAPPIDTVFEEPHFVIIPDPFGNIQDSVRMSLTKSTFEINHLKTVFVQTDDDLTLIAKRYDFNEKKLKKYNELKKGFILKAGQYIFLEHKKRTYNGQDCYHTVRSGQSLTDIAQHYGIKRKSLLKLNKVYKDKEPLAGTIIRLKKVL